MTTGRISLAGIDRWTIAYVLPVGLFVLMTGMFWIGSKEGLHKAYYALFAFPVVVALVAQPHRLLELGRSPLLGMFLVFGAYMVLSLAWSDTETSFGSLAKRPLYIALLFVGTALIARRERNRLTHLLVAATLVAAASALISIAYFLAQGGEGRLPGYGALENPLLTSHVYGMFAAAALAALFVRQQKWFLVAPVFICLFALIVLTGSRTPLLGLAVASLWLLALRGEQRGRWIFAALAAAALSLIALFPEAITSRGLSYRPEIWYQAAIRIAEQPWFGFGYDSSMSFCVAEQRRCYPDTHNLVLAVIYCGGVIGGALWLALLIGALAYAWKARHDTLIVLASTALMFGITAGLTEGESFLSRPKEHWFLIWIPLSLLAAALGTLAPRTENVAVQTRIPAAVER